MLRKKWTLRSTIMYLMVSSFTSEPRKCEKESQRGGDLKPAVIAALPSLEQKYSASDIYSYA